MKHWRRRPPRLHEVGNSITAGDICQHIALTFDHKTKCADAWEEWAQFTAETNTDWFDHIAIITEAGAAIGWIDCSGLGAEELIEDLLECIEPLTIGNLISADTPLLDVARLYGPTSPSVFIVIRGNQPAGWIGYQTLLGTPFQACLFSLLLSIELAVNELMENDPALAMRKLNERRREYARRIAQLRGYPSKDAQRPSDHQLLRCTTFADKAEVLRKCPATTAKLSSYDEALLEKAERVRNSLAHPTEAHELSQLIPKDEIAGFLLGITSLESELYRAIDSGMGLE